jgi:hypothetical protein
MKDTWNKKVKVNNQAVPKKRVRDYYKRLWNKDPNFRENLRKKGLFIRAMYNGKPTIVRKGIKIQDWADLEKLIRDHAVEVHLPVKQYDYVSYIDVDMPPRYVKNRKQLGKSLVNRLKKKGVKVALVTDSPSGVHIFSNTKKAELKNALKEIASEDKRFAVTRSSKTKIALDPTEPNTAVPGSLSCKGKPYWKWKK